MKKLLCSVALFLAVFFALAGRTLAEESDTIIFCKSFDNDFRPIGVSNELAGPVISFIALPGQAFGVPSIYLTLYKHDGARQTLLSRQKEEINPDWNGYGIRNLRIPGEGQFTISLTTEAGKNLAEGSFSITSMDPSANVGSPEIQRGTLKDLFNKYSTQKK